MHPSFEIVIVSSSTQYYSRDGCNYCVNSDTVSSEYLLSFQSSHCHITLLPSPTPHLPSSTSTHLGHQTSAPSSCSHIVLASGGYPWTHQSSSLSPCQSTTCRWQEAWRGTFPPTHSSGPTSQSMWPISM